MFDISLCLTPSGLTRKAYRILLTPLTDIPVGNNEWRFFRRNPEGWGYFFAQRRYHSLM